MGAALDQNVEIFGMITNPNDTIDRIEFCHREWIQYQNNPNVKIFLLIN